MNVLEMLTDYQKENLIATIGQRGFDFFVSTASAYTTQEEVINHLVCLVECDDAPIEILDNRKSILQFPEQYQYWKIYGVGSGLEAGLTLETPDSIKEKFPEFDTTSIDWA